MKLFLTLALLLLAVCPTQAQDTATVEFAWTQPDTTTAGTVMQDGWITAYNLYLKVGNDEARLYGVSVAPVALADSARTMITVQLGVPVALQVEAVDKWGNISMRSEFSDVTIVIPKPPGKPGKPGAVEQ